MLTREQSSCRLTGYIPYAISCLMAPPKKQVKVQRLEIQLHPNMLSWLRLDAKRRDVSLAEVVRIALMKLMNEPS